MQWLDHWVVFVTEVLDQAAFNTRVLCAQYFSARVFLLAKPAEEEPEAEAQLVAEIQALEAHIEDLTTQLQGLDLSLDEMD